MFSLGKLDGSKNSNRKEENKKKKDETWRQNKKCKISKNQKNNIPY